MKTSLFTPLKVAFWLSSLALSSRALPTGFCGPLVGGERWRWKGVLIRKNVRLEEEEEEAAENV